jgi:hypothetical protein
MTFTTHLQRWYIASFIAHPNLPDVRISGKLTHSLDFYVCSVEKFALGWSGPARRAGLLESGRWPLGLGLGCHGLASASLSGPDLADVTVLPWPLALSLSYWLNRLWPGPQADSEPQTALDLEQRPQSEAQMVLIWKVGVCYTACYILPLQYDTWSDAI